MQGGILALDIATKTGFAYGRVPKLADVSPRPVVTTQPQPESGVIQVLSHMGLGHFLSEFSGRLDDLLDDKRPGGLVIEAPILPQTTRFETVRKLMSMAGIAEMAAARRGIRWVRMVQPASVKKHFTGSGRAKKPEMEAACAVRGWVFADDNEADALAIWSLGCELYRGEMAR